MKLWRNQPIRTLEELGKEPFPWPPEEAALWDAAADEALEIAETSSDAKPILTYVRGDNRTHAPSGEVT